MQPFWTSRAFWTLVLMFAFNLLTFFGVVPVGTDIAAIVDGILMILALVFRWQAAGPLTVKK